MKQNQIIKVMTHLRENYQVSRNWALGGRITRLSGIINKLINNGWKFEKQSVGPNGEIRWGKAIGGDFVYMLKSYPKGVKKLLQ